MKAKRLVRRERADADIVEAVDHYRDEGGTRASRGFVDALEDAFGHISRHPRTGSPRYGVELDVADLRSWPLHHCPYLVFYIERSDAVEILRVLHGHRDIPPLLA